MNVGTIIGKVRAKEVTKVKIVVQGLGEMSVDSTTLLCLLPFAVLVGLVLVIGLAVQAWRNGREQASRTRLQEMVALVMMQELQVQQNRSDGCLVTWLLLLLGLLAIPLLRGALH